MEKIQLTTAEMEILIAIAMIMEFENENSGNIPQGGVGEVIISNNLMEPDIYERVANSLYHLGLINDEDFLTEAGQNYIEQLKKDAENIEKDKNAVCGNNYSNVNFQMVYEWLEKFLSSDKIDNVCKIIAAVNALLSIVNTIKQAYH